MDDNTIDLTGTENWGDRNRAENIQPGGYRPLYQQQMRDSQRTALEYAAEGLGDMRLAADILVAPVNDATREVLAEQISREATRLQRLLRALASGALVTALAVGALVAGSGASPASAAVVAGKTWTSAPAIPAAEAPSPDPAASGITYRVTLDRAVVTLAVPFVTSRRVQGGATGGQFCGSVWLNGSPVGYTCSMARTFTVRARLDAAALPVGRSTLWLVDEGAGTAVSATFEARRPSRFTKGTWTDRGAGDVWVAAPIQMYSPAAGRWLPQQASPVYVQELTRRGWRTRATLTSVNGVAAGVVHLGGGVRTVRVVRPEGKTVTATTGATRRVDVTEVPFNVI